MNFNVIITDNFGRKLKKLSKKYRSMKEDFKELFLSLEIDPKQGILLSEDCYKIRLAISSKGKGKSGGARVITYIINTDNNVFLLDIYDKSEQNNISDKELKTLIQLAKDFNN